MRRARERACPQAELRHLGQRRDAGGRLLRAAVNDLATARQALLPCVVNQGVALSRYQWVRPTLEEVFLAISS